MDAFEAGFMGAGQRAWHNKGTVIPEDVVSIEEAFQLVPELASDVVSRPLAFWGADGEWHEVVGDVANVRVLDEKVVGVVSDDYTIVPPYKACGFIDSLLQSGALKCHTAGTVRGGRQWWMLFRLPEDIKIGGHDLERIVPFLLATNSYDRSSGFDLATTPVRTVCLNTIRAGLANAVSRWSMRHVGSLDGKMMEARQALELTTTYYAEFKELGDHLIAQPFAASDMRELLDRLTPFQIPQHEDTDRKAANREDGKRAIMDYFTTAPNLTETPSAGTKWAAYNAVAEWSDWDKISRASKLGDTSGQARFSRIMNGDAVKDEALALLV